MFPILECDIHIHQPFQVGDVFRNYCEHKPNTSSEKHDGNTRDLTLSLYCGVDCSERGILKCPPVPSPGRVLRSQISVECRGQCRAATFYQVIPLPASPGPGCLAQVTGPVTGPDLDKKRNYNISSLTTTTTTTYRMPCSLNMELQPALKIS